MMQGYVHSTERFGTVDGRGIRYVLFLAGCPLRCRFCHNPDTWQQGSKTLSVAAALQDILRYRHFYDASGGGLTVSGGEPLQQWEFTAALFAACQSHNLHTTLDTSGFAEEAAFAAVLEHTDAVLFSIKAVDTEKHRQLTGRDNALILRNLALAADRVPLTVRYVLLPGLTDTPAELTALAGLLRSLPVVPPVELLPYHSMGRHKWQTLGLLYTLDGIPDATAATVEAAAAILAEQGIKVLYQPSAAAAATDTAG